MIESRKRLIVMADIFLTVEGNTRTRRKWVLAQRASPGSESVACLEGMFSERGIPLLLSTMRVSPDKSKKTREAKWQQGSRRGHSTVEASNDRGGKGLR